MSGDYSPPVGAMWKRKDRNDREYFFLQVDFDGMRYAYHVFSNKYKETPTQPDFKVFPLDNGEGKPIERRPEKKTDYRTQPPPDQGERDDKPVEDAATGEQEDDDAPF